MVASLAPNTIKQYDVCLKKWWTFCNQRSLNYFSVPVHVVVDFLTQQYENGSQYGTLNSCRSALSLILGPIISNNDILQRFFKGVYRLRPPLPRYDITWDTNIVLDHLSGSYPNEDLCLEQLSKKTITLLALATAHRVQTFSKIKTINIEKRSDQIIIKIPDIIKTSRPGSKQPILVIPHFKEKPTICPAAALLAYIDKTSSLRKCETLFIGLKKPHLAVGPQSLSRWIKRTLGDSGLDTAVFSAHSTRHAATSRARSLGVSIETIRNTAGWSDNSNTFAKFYNRVISTTENVSLATSVFD